MSTILTPDALRALERPTGYAVGLPRQAFTSQAFLDDELARVFAPTWIYAGAASAIPEPGDTLPAMIGNAPVVLVRGRDGAVRAFHNICRHRAALVVTEPGTKRTSLVCPYHGWTYDLDGGLLRTPHIGGTGKHTCEGIDRGNLGLKPVRCNSWGGLLFVNLSGEAPPLADHLRPLADRWSAYDVSRFRYAGSIDYTLACNWKLAVENYLESYHLPWVHPSLNSYSRLDDHYMFEAGTVAYGQVTTVYAPNLACGLTLPSLDGLDAATRARAEYPVIFPSLLVGLQCDHFYVINVVPLAPDRTFERFDLFYVDGVGSDDRLAPARVETRDRWNAVFVEDVGIVESAQRGRGSPAMDGGRFSAHQDALVHLFEKSVARLVAAPPSARTGQMSA